MKDKINYSELFAASYREALELSCKAGVSEKAKKKFVLDNTRFIYDDCKRNPKLREYILSKHKRR